MPNWIWDCDSEHQSRVMFTMPVKFTLETEDFDEACTCIDPNSEDTIAVPSKPDTNVSAPSFKETTPAPTTNTSAKPFLSFYPNPANDHLVMTCDNEDLSIRCQIYDLNGKLFSDEFLQNNEQIDISRLPEGFYMIRSSCDGKELGQTKIIVAR
jgi:hypothetical protein